MHLFNFSSSETQNLVYLLLLLTLVASGILRSRDFTFGKILQYLTIWSVVALFGVFLYTYRFELSDFKSRILGELQPTKARVNSNKQIVINIAQDGHFYVDVKINSTPVKFMIDTGASAITLSKEDALRVGIDLQNLTFNQSYQTANGISYGAATKLSVLEIGNVRFININASVNNAAMGVSLLGMNFLRQFQKYEFYRDRLVLTIQDN